MKIAHIRLRARNPWLSRDDIERLTALYDVAIQRGYAPVSADISQQSEEAAAWWPTWRQRLKDGEFAAVVCWDDDLDRPDIVTQADVRPDLAMGGSDG